MTHVENPAASSATEIQQEVSTAEGRMTLPEQLQATIQLDNRPTSPLHLPPLVGVKKRVSPLSSPETMPSEASNVASDALSKQIRVAEKARKKAKKALKKIMALDTILNGSEELTLERKAEVQEQKWRLGQEVERLRYVAQGNSVAYGARMSSLVEATGIVTATMILRPECMYNLSSTRSYAGRRKPRHQKHPINEK